MKNAMEYVGCIMIKVCSCRNAQAQDLKAFAVQPVYVHPTHYTSDDGYFTDTEWADSAPLDAKDEL